MDNLLTAATDRNELYLRHVRKLRDLSLDGVAPLSPDGLWISITGNCNFKCVGCWREGLFTKTYVSVAEVKTMLAGSLDRRYSYISFTWGEAFLHPQLCDIIELCREMHPEAVIDLMSNGSIPPRGRFAKAVSMIDDLGLSIDGATKATYEAIRLGGNFEKFLENTAEIVAIRAATGKPRDLTFSFTANTRNIAELPDLVSLAADLGVPCVYAQPMEMLHPEIVARVGQYDLHHMPREDIYRIADAAMARGQTLGVRVDLAGFLERPVSAEADVEPSAAEMARDVREYQYPYRKPFLLMRSGEKYRVLLCCYMVEDAGDLAAERYGLEFDTPPEAVTLYNSPAFWHFRTDMATGKAGDLCGRCMQARTSPWHGPQ
jgi:pyruvate-formate lyase-activating enzyme